MDAVKVDRLIEGQGTPENTWDSWLKTNPIVETTAKDLLRDRRRVVLLAPHPDDEILPCGGILAQLSALNIPILIVAVTDGEASHPGSKFWSKEKLQDVRPEESSEALGLLNINAQVVRLKLPDGEVSSYKGTLASQLEQLLDNNDVVISPWLLDGHPDHEAVTDVANQLTNRLSIPLMEVPIWMWHWASPEESRIPWHRARIIKLSKITRYSKERALLSFRSQIILDEHSPTTPILPKHVIERFIRPFEVVFI